MKNKVQFEMSGKINLKEKCFLTSKDRIYNKNQTIFHRNAWHSVVTIPIEVFRKYFEYERFSGIYQTFLTYEQLIEAGSILWSINIDYYSPEYNKVIDYNNTHYCEIFQEYL